MVIIQDFVPENAFIRKLRFLVREEGSVVIQDFVPDNAFIRKLRFGKRFLLYISFYVIFCRGDHWSPQSERFVFSVKLFFANLRTIFTDK